MIEERLSRLATILAVWGAIGNFLSLWENEYIIGGASPFSLGINVIKGGNTLCSLAMFIVLVRYYWVCALFRSLSNHLDYCVALSEVTWREVLLIPSLWIEVFVCVVHLPPLISFAWETNSMGNIIVYQAETIFCIANSCRLYLFWRVIRFRVLKRLPKRHTVARCTSVRFNNLFALKILLNGDAGVQSIGIIWCLGVFIMAYWYRSAELTSCQFASKVTNATWVGRIGSSPVNWEGPHHAMPGCLEEAASVWVIYGHQELTVNDYNMWNALWCLFITTATVGYGDYVPKTHAGRFTCAAAAIFGIVNAALLTAALCNGVQWSAEESAAVRLFEREEARSALGPAAASLIVMWWRKKRQSVQSNEFLARLLAVRMRFQTIKKVAMVEMDDCVDHKTRVDQLAKMAKYVEMACTEIGSKITSGQQDPERCIDTKHSTLISLTRSLATSSHDGHDSRRPSRDSMGTTAQSISAARSSSTSLGPASFKKESWSEEDLASAGLSSLSLQRLDQSGAGGQTKHNQSRNLEAASLGPMFKRNEGNGARGKRHMSAWSSSAMALR